MPVHSVGYKILARQCKQSGSVGRLAYSLQALRPCGFHTQLQKCAGGQVTSILPSASFLLFSKPIQTMLASVFFSYFLLPCSLPQNLKIYQLVFIKIYFSFCILSHVPLLHRGTSRVGIKQNIFTQSLTDSEKDSMPSSHDQRFPVWGFYDLLQCLSLSFFLIGK